MYSGKDSAAQRGVGLAVSERMSRIPTGRLSISARVLVAKSRASPFALIIIQVYAPTEQSDDSAVKKFYEEVGEAMKQAKSRDLMIVRSDGTANTTTKIPRTESNCQAALR